MQDLKPETVGHIINRVRELNAGAETVQPDEEAEAYERGQHEVDETALEQERHDEHEHDPVYQELTAFIAGLSLDAQYELIALAWLGRGDGSRDDFDDLTALARDRHSDHTAGYLLAMPLLGEYLADGLEAFDFAVSEFEQD